jgi:ligand-binding SRPBCC domain-containing protein
MGLIIKGDDINGEIFKGQKILLLVKPLLGITTTWVTQITFVERYKLFINKQIKGPYKFWEHQHHFKTIGSGTQVRDIIKYELPYGVLGLLAHKIFIKKQLDDLFNYRRQKLKELFGTT